MDYLESRSLVSKLLLPAAVISSIGYGGYTYQNALNSEQLQSDSKMIPFEELDLTPGDTEFDKIVSKDITYSNNTLSFGDEITNLQAPIEPLSKLKRVAVGHAGLKEKKNLRAMLNHPDKPAAWWNDPSHSMSYAGWTNQMSFLVFSEQVPGTKRVALGKAGISGKSGDFRAFVNHPDFDQTYWNNKNNKMTYDGWTHYQDFWALDSAQPGSIRVAVGQASSSAKQPRRMMLNHPTYSQAYWNDQRNPMSVLGWSHYYQFWAYPSDLVIDELVYQLDKAKIVGQKPKGFQKQELINRSSLVQTNSISFTYTVSETSSWSHSIGVGLMVTAGGEAGVPFLAKGKWEVSVATTYDFTKTKTVTTTTTKDYTSPAYVAPWTRLEAECYIQEAKLQVPYELKFKSKYGAVARTLKGLWSGVAVSKVKCDYNEFPL